MAPHISLHTFNMLKMLLVVTAIFTISGGSFADKMEETAGGGEVGAVEGSGGESAELVKEDSGEGERTHRANPFPDEDEVNLNTADLGKLFEGDIVLTSKQKREMGLGDEPQRHVHKRAVVRSSSDLWPNAVVPYYISSSLPSSYRSAIRAAMDVFTENTCVRFTPRTSQSSYVYFIRGNGCYSYIGRTGGVQEISIGDGCQYRGIVIHEIFHALGRWHEHSRPDRNNYITVNYNNIRSGLEDQFFRLSSSRATTNGIGYDYGSIMHYSAYAFSRNNAPTIVPRSSGASLNSLGQRSGLSSSDLRHVNALYCRNYGQWSSWSSWSSCSASCGSGMQTRTRSCEGSGCAGSSTQSRSCSAGTSCMGQWGRWGAWSSCFPSCGSNRRRTRSRSCLAPGTCTGSSTQTRSCTSISCENEWLGWSRCSSCRGLQYRQRACSAPNPSRSCPRPYYQLRSCSQSTQCQNGRQSDQQLDSGGGLPTSAGRGVAVTSVLSGSAAVLLSLFLLF